jgi:hypothetical protein
MCHGILHPVCYVIRPALGLHPLPSSCCHHVCRKDCFDFTVIVAASAAKTVLRLIEKETFGIEFAWN